jgi:hypothetical protein
MKILRFEGYTFRQIVKDPDLFRKAAAWFISSKHAKVHRVSFNLLHFAMLNMVNVTIAPTEKSTIVKAPDGTVLAVAALRDRKDFPDDGVWPATTDDGFVDWTKRRADGYGIVGKYEYGFGLGYKRQPVEKKEYFRERRKNSPAPSHTKNNQKYEKANKRKRGEGRRFK